MYILVIGRPMDGFTFDGLFSSEADAEAYGEKVYPQTEWWIAPIKGPIQTFVNVDGPYYGLVNELNDILYGLLRAVSNDDVNEARIYAAQSASKSTELYNELILMSSTRQTSEKPN